MLLERRVVIDAQGNFGMTLIHWAMQLRRIQITRLLLEYGADVIICDEMGRNASQYAWDQEMAQLLSEYGADLQSGICLSTLCTWQPAGKTDTDWSSIFIYKIDY